MLSAGIHGTEHRVPERRAFRHLAPRKPVSPAPGSLPGGTPPAFPLSPVRNPKLVTAFPSPATAASFKASIPGSKVPTCYFASLPARSTTRSASRLHAFDRFASGRSTLPCLAPVAASRTCMANCASCLHSPSGVFAPSGSKRSAEFAASRSALRIRPISVRSPQPDLVY